MQNGFIIKANEHWPFSEGKLNQILVESAKTNLQNKGDFVLAWKELRDKVGQPAHEVITQACHDRVA